MGSEVSISATAMPAPKPTQSSRSGKSVTPAMGASTTGFASFKAPICKPADAALPASVRRGEEARVIFGVGVLATNSYPDACWVAKHTPQWQKDEVERLNFNQWRITNAL